MTSKHLVVQVQQTTINICNNVIECDTYHPSTSRGANKVRLLRFDMTPSSSSFCHVHPRNLTTRTCRPIHQTKTDTRPTQTRLLYWTWQKRQRTSFHSRRPWKVIMFALIEVSYRNELVENELGFFLLWARQLHLHIWHEHVFVNRVGWSAHIALAQTGNSIHPFAFSMWCIMTL